MKDTNILNFVRGALDFSVWRENSSRDRLRDQDPMPRADELSFRLSQMSPRELRRNITEYSSFIYGSNILDDIFPPELNPIPEGLKGFIENPVQVLGGDYCEQKMQEGESKKLNRYWIEHGFWARSLKRRIDPDSMQMTANITRLRSG